MLKKLPHQGIVFQEPQEVEQSTPPQENPFQVITVDLLGLFSQGSLVGLAGKV